MKLKLVYFILLLFSAQLAQAVCLTQAQADQLGCERYSAGDGYCAANFGEKYLAFRTTNECSKKQAAKLNGSGGGILLTVRSLTDEVESLIDQFDDGSDHDYDFFSLPKVRITSFKDARVTNLLSTMKELKAKLLELTKVDAHVDTMTGKTIIILANQYLGFLTRVYRIYAQAAHTSNQFKYMNYSNLNYLSPHFDKKIALELLSRLNLKAKHIDANTLEIVVSEAEKQSYEYYAVDKPDNLTDYAKLVQFMSLRDLITNKWALQRMSNKNLDNPVVSSCGQGMLSFRPGSDSKMSSSEATKELFAFDIFYSDYAPLLPEMAKSTLKHNIIGNWSANNIVDTVFDKVPTIEYFLSIELGWDETEIDSWKQELATTLWQNERNEWKLYSDPIVNTVIFPGDKLDPNYVAQRVVEDSFKIRVEAVKNQLIQSLIELPIEDIKTIEGIVDSKMAQFKTKWEANTKADILEIVKSVTNTTAIRNKNREEKIKETIEVAKAAMPSIHVTETILEKKLKKLHQQSALNVKGLDLKSPLELMSFFQQKLGAGDAGFVVSTSMDHKEEYANAVTDFFRRVGEEYTKKIKNVDVNDHAKLARILRQAAYSIAGSILSKHKIEYNPLFTYSSTGKETYKYEAKVDNTYVAQRPMLIPKFETPTIPEMSKNQNTDAVPEWFNYERPVIPNDTTANSVSNYDMLSMMRYAPAVADNTRVAVQRYIPELGGKTKSSKKHSAQLEYYNPYELEYIAKDMSWFYRNLFELLNLSGARAGGTSTGSFYRTIADQKIVADQRLANAYTAAPMLKIPLSRDYYTYKYYGGGMGYGSAVKVKESEEKPALIRMLQAATVKNGYVSISDAKLRELVEETISVAELSQKGQVDTFCGANYRDYDDDKKYKTLFRSATFVRQSITNDQGLSPEESEKLQELDEKLRKETRYWHEAISEDYIEPMMMVAMVIFIIAAFVLPLIGSAGLLSPGAVMLLITILDGADLVITGASLYFRGMANFYEVPAQVRFQKSLVMSQVTDLKLTTWEDYEQAKKSNDMDQLFTALFAPVDAIVGGQFYFSARKLLGVTGKNALKRMGVPARSFGRPPKTAMFKSSFSALKKEHGVMTAITRKSKEMLHNAKMWLPRYQPYSGAELAKVVRVGLVTKADEIGYAAKPWLMKQAMGDFVQRIDSRLTTVAKHGDEAVEAYKMTGRMSLKEFIAKPGYSKEVLFPVSFIRAVKKGEVGKYLSSYGEVMESISRLRGKFMKNKANVMNTMMSKLDEVQQVAVKRPDLLTKEHKNAFDYFQSLLSDDELKIFKEFTKFTKSEAKGFRKVFKDHDKIMEGLVPMTGVHGVQFAAHFMYPNALADEIVEGFEPQYKDAADDLRSFYETMLKNESYGDLEDDLIILHRRSIEEALY